MRANDLGKYQFIISFKILLWGICLISMNLRVKFPKKYFSKNKKYFVDEIF